MGLIDKILTNGAKALVDSIGGILDNTITTKDELEAAKLKIAQEVNRHTEVLSSQASEEEKVFLLDVQDARANNMKIQGDKPSWLAKNLAYIIDLFVTLLWGSLTTYLMAVMLHLAPKVQGVDYTAVTAVWGAVTAQFGTVINFHRGSSQGSHEKQKLLDRLTDSK